MCRNWKKGKKQKRWSRKEEQRFGQVPREGQPLQAGAPPANERSHKAGDALKWGKGGGGKQRWQTLG